jgi:hypothetical protein
MPENNIKSYIVLKSEYVDDCLSPAQKEALEDILHTIYEYRVETGRNPLPMYYVVNINEPYADEVRDLIAKNNIGE